MEYNYRQLFKGLAQFRPALSFELVGRTLEAKLDGKGSMILSFPTKKELYLLYDGINQDNPYEMVKIDDEVYVFHFEVLHQSPRRCLSIVYDAASGQITVFDARQGQCTEYPRKVERDIYFGAVKGADGTYPEGRAGFTSDLCGRAIDFTYTSDVTVRHTYIEPHLFRWKFVEAAPGDSALGATQKEYCDFVKINDHIYIFSWLEKIAGVQGWCVENLDRMYHAGGFFGIGPDDKPECYCMAAYGKPAPFDPS